MFAILKNILYADDAILLHADKNIEQLQRERFSKC